VLEASSQRIVETLPDDALVLDIGGWAKPFPRADWVLDTFAKREEPEVAILVDDAADAVGSLIADGLLATQDRYNRSAPRET